MSEELRAAAERWQTPGSYRPEAHGGSVKAGVAAMLADAGDLAEAHCRHLAEHPADDAEPVTASIESEAWLRSIGGLPNDPGPGESVELAWNIWSRGETESYGTEPAMHVLWASGDNSWWIEAYDTGGETLAIVELEPRRTRGDVRRLFAALGIKVPA